ncbi:ankyrin repeat and KH domain-containing protein 1 isoform X10 [Callorhinchus milii]|uniref:ankyrin repeat and KH domain-containing protein 1 isoform X10 n=1 Tax=Callorhinchus milii TaxID=7868 RepID=UPI001C3FA19A|nr:ankyrin repeat and KH domain-containing protein 1 isoform X10 [Callorhinchus milii]
MQNEVIAESRALAAAADTMTDAFEDEIDSVTAAVSTKVRILEPTPGDRLDFQLAVLSGSEEDEVSEVESFILDQEDPMIKTASELLLSSAADGTDLRTVDPETQARLEALLEAAGIGKLSTADGKAFADPEVLRRLTSSVSCALDEAAAALTRMRAENTLNAGQADNRSLAEACSDGDVNAVRKLLDEGRSVNEHTEEGESLLCLACSAGYYELAQVLLAVHANVEDRGIKGDITPLMAAASGGYVDIVKLLLAHDADVNAQSSTGNTALTYACAGGFVDVVKELLKAGANIEDHNENGHTPLMEAASAGHVEVARVLLEYGAGINTHSNEFKESALTLACYKGHLEMVRFLLEAGADQEHKTDEMHTALMEACMDGHVEVARLLLDSGAQVNMPADSFESPLTLAACGGHVELAALLIERGANLEEVNDEGYTPLMEASREGHEEMVALLLAQGANINAQTEETQETALTLACCGGFLEVADFLIKAGADIELGCSTPLMEAAQEGHLELVKYLLAAGANVHATTATGDTALTYACENGHTDVADVLLQAGADLEHESEGGRTPLMKAARAGHLCTVQFLISKGANVNRATANNDHTVVSLACAGGHLAVVELLLAHGADPTHRLKDGSTMLIEAAKGGHTNVVSYLLDYPNNILPVPGPDVAQLTPPSHDQSQVPRVPVQALAMVVPPQEPDQSPVNVGTTLSVINKVSSRMPAGPNASSHTTTPPTPQTRTQTPSPVVSPSSMLPLYPSVEIDAQVGHFTESNHDTALTLACAGGHEELVSVLIARGANIEHRDKKGFTPLILAATAGHVGVVEILLDKGADIEAQSERTKDTPLSLACSGGRQEVVELLLARGANKEHRNVSDYTPLSLAASGGYVNIIKILLNAGAEINSRTGSKLGISPLMLAAMNGHVASVKLLLDMGSDINAQIETNRNTALTLACFQGRAEVVSLLLDRKANVEHRAKTGLTPLMEAASGGYAEVGRVLLDKGADVNAPPVPSSRDTALTIAADKGHYKFCELLINRGAHIDVRNKKGNTPLWLAANGGHFDVVQLLVQAGADVDAADNRKITPLMAAFRKGHVKVVQYLVKEVNQFPSDIECMRYIATITDKELLKKCHQCMETIVKAKDQQAAEANKNASILLKELDLEKSREESRKLALAAKREKRKEKRKKKKEEQKRKQEEEEARVKESSEKQQTPEKDRYEVEEVVPIEPPSATTTTTIGISATSATFTSAYGKKRANVVTTPSTNRKNKKNKTKDCSQGVQIILEDQHMSIAQQKADKNKINGEPRGGGVGGNSDSDNVDSTDCNSECSSGGKSQELNLIADFHNYNDQKLYSSRNDKSNTSTSENLNHTRLHDNTSETSSTSLSASHKSTSLPLSSPTGKMNLTSPKRGQKREDGWKEVVRRCRIALTRSKKLSVPASVVSRIMGRGGCNISAIQDVTGAHIDVDKQKDKNGERMITIRGGTESTRHAVQLINALIQDPTKELEDLIPRNHIKSVTANTRMGSTTATTTASTTTAGNRITVSMISSSITASQSTASSASLQSINKPTKNIVANNMRPTFSVSLPLAYSHPQLAHALLAAQTIQQIRHPRLPMAHFGGTFTPSANTWGPFPVRPVSPGSTNSSPKHSAARLNNQTSSSIHPESVSSATLSSPSVAVSPSTFTTQSICVTSNPTPSSVRKQLFTSVNKTNPMISVTSSVTSSCSSLTTSSTLPVSNEQPSTPPPPPPPSAQPSQQPMPLAKSEAFTTPAGKEEMAAATEQLTGSQCAHVCPSSSANSNPGAMGILPTILPQIPGRSCSDIRPPLPKPYISNPDHGLVAPSSLASTRPVTMSAAPNIQTNNTLPQLAAASPVSHRIQPGAPFYPLVQQEPQSVFVPNPVPMASAQDPMKQHGIPSPMQLSSALGMLNVSQMHANPGSKSLPPNFGSTALFSPFNSFFDNTQVSANHVWGSCPLPSRPPQDPTYTGHSNYIGNSVLGQLDGVLPHDNSKAPGFRPPSQRVTSSPTGMSAMDPSANAISSATPMTSYAPGMAGCQAYLQGPAPVGMPAPSFSRQHFSPHPWSSTTAPATCESPVPSVSSGASSPLSASSAPSSLGQSKANSANQDRKVPPPIGTERSARIRQTGSMAPLSTMMGSNLTTPVGQGGIWSFGVSNNSDGISGWSQGVMGSHLMHQSMSDPASYSQHQPMERDDTGIVAPSNTFHQPVPSNFMDYNKQGLPLSMYGNAMIPPHPQLADGPGAPLFNGLHAADPAWNPMIKVVTNSENTDSQQVWPGTWAPHIGNVHLNHVN